MAATSSRTLLCVAEVDAHEGPAYAGSSLFFTTVRPDVAIKRLLLDGLEAAAIETVSADANAANGMTPGPDGRLLVCEQGSLSKPARISALDPMSGEAETVVEAYDGLPLNSPNDIVVRRDGTIWFTDPSYGHLQGFRPQPALPDAVYRYDPGTGDLTVVTTDFDKPNGLAFSPDERTLYVGESGANPHVRAFDDVGDRVFAVVPGYPDGIKVDTAGRVYSSCDDGVQVFDAAGDLVDEIELPGAVNFCFGGPERNVLFITTDTAVWAAVMETKGA
jgi:gluconolactonase